MTKVDEEGRTGDHPIVAIQIQYEVLLIWREGELMTAVPVLTPHTSHNDDTRLRNIFVGAKRQTKKTGQHFCICGSSRWQRSLLTPEDMDKLWVKFCCCCFTSQDLVLFSNVLTAFTY